MSADFGAPALDKFRENLPDQFIHSGISEQHMIDMAAGLALDGNKVYVYAMAPFITLRCLEQIKCSLAMMSLPVTILGVGIGLGYADAGPTHYLNEDISVMNSIVNLDICSPSDESSLKFIAKQTIDIPKLRYIRMERNSLKNIYPNDYYFNKEGFEIIHKGKNICILSTGYMLHKAKEAGEKLLNDNIDVSIYDVRNIKPLSNNLITEISKYEKTTIIYESPHRLKKLLKELYAFCGGDREIIVARELTKKFEEHIGYKIDEVIEFFEDKEVIGEITVVVKGINEKMSTVNEVDLKKDLKELINAGLSLSSASKYLAKKTGIKKSTIYKLN